ncbi:hypothetical protein CDAR_385811 [Caerostris darwini]|uniref:Uncharacterized protein n=1 Tax=Caerostris darwini TaxID=1538125 RepID=A0AAV4N6F2_9ARAC|nr:hypothetical protein CDAR_385811 [Caerostris darwini]
MPNYNLTEIRHCKMVLTVKQTFNAGHFYNTRFNLPTLLPSILTPIPPEAVVRTPYATHILKGKHPTVLDPVIWESTSSLVHSSDTVSLTMHLMIAAYVPIFSNVSDTLRCCKENRNCNIKQNKWKQHENVSVVNGSRDSISSKEKGNRRNGNLETKVAFTEFPPRKLENWKDQVLENHSTELLNGFGLLPPIENRNCDIKQNEWKQHENVSVVNGSPVSISSKEKGNQKNGNLETKVAFAEFPPGKLENWKKQIVEKHCTELLNGL